MGLMQGLIEWVRQARRIRFFKYPVRMLLLVLLMAGMWVATQPLEFPESISVNDKLIHVIVFFGFAMIMDMATSRRPFWFWKGLPLLGYGIFIEVLQYFSPDRSFSVMDMVADVSGIILYYLLKYTLRLLAFR